jgi:hypothetical protein
VSEQEKQPPVDPHHHTRRDAETLMMLGGFVTFIAVPVLIGTVWADRTSAMVVNIVAGAVLFCVGVGMFLYGLKTKKEVS